MKLTIDQRRALLRLLVARPDYLWSNRPKWFSYAVLRAYMKSRGWRYKGRSGSVAGAVVWSREGNAVTILRDNSAAGEARPLSVMTNALPSIEGRTSEEITLDALVLALDIGLIPEAKFREEFVA